MLLPSKEKSKGKAKKDLHESMTASMAGEL